MTWCERESICALIDTGRLSPNVPEEARRQADLQFIHLCQTAVNAGDVLVLNALDTQLSVGVRLTSALAVEPMINVCGWVNGHQFSDKALTTSLVWNYVVNFLNTSPTSDPGNLVSAILRIISKIILLEFPEDRWKELLTSMIGDGSVLLTGGYRLDFLKLITSQCKSNSMLWSYLAEKVEENWWNPLLKHSSPFRSCGFEVLWNLLKASPKDKPAVLSSTLTLQPANQIVFLEASRLMNDVRSTLQQYQLEANIRLGEEEERGRYFKELEWALLIAQSVTKNETQAHFLFQAVSFFVTRFLPFYFAELPFLSQEVAGVVQSGLSDLQCILMTFPEEPFEDMVGTIRTVMMYLVRLPSNSVECSHRINIGADVDYIDEEMTRLQQHVMEEEVVPLGCGGDDVPSLAGCILELFLEKNISQCVPVLSSLFSLFEQVEREAGGPPAVLSFFSNAVFHIGRVGMMSSHCLAIDIAAACSSFFPQLYSIVWTYGFSHPLPCATLVYGASQLFFLFGGINTVAPGLTGATSSSCSTSTNDAVSSEIHTECAVPSESIIFFLNFLEQVYHVASLDVNSSASHKFLAAISLYSIAAILQHAESSPSFSVHHLVKDSWWGISWEIASKASSQFQLFASCELLNVIMGLCQEIKYSLSEFTEGFLSVIKNFCHYSVVRAVPTVLAKFLKLLLDHQPGGLCCTLQKGLQLLGEKCCSFDAPSSSLILREVSVMIADISIHLLLRSSSFISSPYYCKTCCFFLVSGFLPLLCQFANTMRPFEETTARSLSVCFSTCMLAFQDTLRPHAELALQSTCCVFASSTQEHHSSSTISGVSSSVAIQLLSISQCREFDVGLVHYVHLALGCLFSSPTDETHLIEGRRGVHYLGVIFLLSLAFIHNPSACLQGMVRGLIAPSVISKEVGSQPSQNPQREERSSIVWQRALGWSCSLALFADDATWPYILSGWLSLFSYILTLTPDEQESIFFTSLPHNRVYAFPSVYSTKIPKKMWNQQSLVGAMITGLLLVKYSKSKATRLSGFRKELHHLLLAKNMLPYICTTNSFSHDSLGLFPLLENQVSPSKSAQTVLEKLSDLGFQMHIKAQEQDIFFLEKNI